MRICRLFQKEELDLNDKVAFAARYLNDERLVPTLNQFVEQSEERGDLQALILTGLSFVKREKGFVCFFHCCLLGLGESGCHLIQRYLDRSNDIRTAALFGAYVSEDVLHQCPFVFQWIEG